ncbi:hypothetical protein [Rahnella aceris]|uniref:hypothetical protein n=1 Tax=Rahnella sp. (strain Y9602) TaxID=2703885 RepID=UPI003FD55EBB
MITIKNIIYLDYEKMYSLSAQVFKGVIFESIIEKGYSFSETDRNSKTDEHSNTDHDSRKNYIKPYDYHYSMFEDKLLNLEKITMLEHGKFSERIDFSEIKLKPFIKSTGRVMVTDPLALYNLTKEFKDHNTRLKYITGSESISGLYESLQLLNKDDTKKIGIIKGQIKTLEAEIDYQANTINQKYHDYLAEVLKFSYGEEIEINQVLGDYLVSAFMERNFFKLPISTLLKRYSRKTVTEFTMLGIVTQYKEKPWELPEISFPDFRKSAKNMVNANYDIEMTFLSPAAEEIIIEPIAMYTEL